MQIMWYKAISSHHLEPRTLAKAFEGSVSLGSLLTLHAALVLTGFLVAWHAAGTVASAASGVALLQVLLGVACGDRVNGICSAD